MIRKRQRSSIIFFCVALPLIAAILLLEVRVDRSIATVFEVFPAQKWVLAKGTEAQITSTVIDYRSAISNNISVVQFERGESMNFHLASSIGARASLAAGDTVAVVSSSRLQEQLITLRGSLLVAQAGLAAKSAGEKESLIEQGRKQVEYSEARIVLKRIPFERKRELFKRGYIANEEFETAAQELRQAEIENEINHAQLAVYTSGSKKEDLEVLRSTIRSLQNEIGVLEARLEGFVLRSPVSGELIRNFSRDTLLIVNNTSSLILNVQIRFEKTGALAEGDTVRLALKHASAELSGRIVAISKVVETVNAVQIVTARIAIDGANTRLLPGLTVGGEIILGRETLLDHMAALFDR